MNKSHKEINWATPSEEDLAYLKSLSEEQYRALLDAAVKDSLISEPGKMTHEQIWQEALRRSRQAA